MEQWRRGLVGTRQVRLRVDVRVSVIPMIFGEGAVMRLLDKATVLFTLPELGLDEETFDKFQTLIVKPHGILLVTGPTGSGKSTTLYSCVAAVAHPEVNVTTVEDPVEYAIDGIGQTQGILQLRPHPDRRGFLAHALFANAHMTLTVSNGTCGVGGGKKLTLRWRVLYQHVA